MEVMSEYFPGEDFSGNFYEEQLILMNEEDIREAQEEGARLRNWLLRRTHAVVRLLLERDMDEQDSIQSPDGSGSGNRSIHYYVRTDILATPTRDEEFSNALSVLLVPNGDLIRRGKMVERDTDQLKLFLPIPDKFNPHTDEVLGSDVIYVEKTEQKSGETHHYVITQNGIFRYRPPSASEEGESFDESESIEVILHRAAMYRVSEGLGILGGLREDIINMSAIPQRTVTLPQVPNE